MHTEPHNESFWEKKCYLEDWKDMWELHVDGT